MPKQADKQVRQNAKANMRQKKGVRKGIGKQLRLDVEKYEQKYPDKKLMLINDVDGDVQRWLDLGAEPVPRETMGRQAYEGIDDKHESDWVTFHGGSDEGRPFKVYLLMMDPGLYYEVKIAPQEERQEAIREAMQQGANASDQSPHLPGGGGVQTYAPNLPTGEGRGYNEIRPQNETE